MSQGLETTSFTDSDSGWKVFNHTEELAFGHGIIKDCYWKGSTGIARSCATLILSFMYFATQPVGTLGRNEMVFKAVLEPGDREMIMARPCMKQIIQNPSVEDALQSIKKAIRLIIAEQADISDWQLIALSGLATDLRVWVDILQDARFEKEKK